MLKWLCIESLAKIYTGVFGNFLLVGDDGDLSVVVSLSEIKRIKKLLSMHELFKR